jgi:FkbM family methyltransferase
VARFRVLAIEANPELVQNALTRFARESRTGRLMILNVGIAEEQGSVLPFWICDADSRLSSFDQRLASLNGSCPHHEIRVPCQRFRSILKEFGVPFYMKVDIQGHDYFCVKDLDSQQLPKRDSHNQDDTSAIGMNDLQRGARMLHRWSRSSSHR